MKVWVVQFVPDNIAKNYCQTRIYGVYDSYQKAKEKAIYEIDEDIRCNDFVVNKEVYEDFKNYNKEHEDISIEVFADREENYSEYYTISIIPMNVE